MKSFNQFIKELKSMEGLERFNWYVLKPIALMILILVFAFMQDGQHQQGEQLFPFFLPLFLKLILCWTLFFFVAAFKTWPGLLAWCPAPGPTPGNAKLTPKIAKELNAQDRKKLQKKIKLERKRSQKLGQKKRGECPFDFLEVRLMSNH